MRHFVGSRGVGVVRRRSRGFGLVALSAVFALSTILFAVPAMAGTSSVAWNHSTGLDLVPGTETQVAQLNLPDPAGSECTADVEAINGNSTHRGNNLNVYLNGGLLVSLAGFENMSGQVSNGSAGFISSGADVLVVRVESTRARITSSEGSLTVTCEPPPPDGGEGCTPGYWKQQHHFDSWGATGFEPGDSFDVVFGVAGNIDTLLDGLEAKGGGENALARHAVAALLNATHPDVNYDITAGEVIGLVQGAYNTGQFEAAKNILNDANEAGCPLN